MALIKEVIEVELLYDDGVNNTSNMSLTDIDFEMTEGSMSGTMKSKSMKTLTKIQMAKALRKQGSDPCFLDCEDKD